MPVTSANNQYTLPMTNSTDSGKSFSWRREVRHLFTLNEGPWRWSVGIQAAIASGLPMLLFTLAGYQPFGLLATLGSFTALYCASLRRIERLQALPLVGAGFVLVSALGALCSGNAWLAAMCLIVVTVLACLITLGFRLGPPGPMMFVLVAGISSHLAAPGNTGTPAIQAFLIPLLVAAGALSAYLVVIAPLALPAVRRRDGSASGLRSLFPRIQFDQQTAVIALRVVAAVAIASLLSLPLGIHRTYWVVMVAGVVLQVSHSLRITMIRAAQRVLGSFLGLATFALVTLGAPTGIWLIVVIALLQFAVEVVVVRNYALGLIFITPVALTITAAGQAADSLVLMSDRIIDTVLGAAIAIAVLWISQWIQNHGENQTLPGS